MKGLTASRWGLPALLILGAVLLTLRLDNGRLWQDEAETAVLGKNILAFGYPKAFDGRNRLNPTLNLQESQAWTYHTWLPLYLAAGGLKLGGVNTAAARLPFALLGLGCVWLTYGCVKRLTRERSLALLTAGLLATSVPFLLHMRQCRYYAPALFFTLLSVIAYARFLGGKPRGPLGLGGALLLLFHADHGVFAPVLAALTLHLLVSRRRKSLGYSFAAVGLIVLACVAPWIVYLKGFQHGTSPHWEHISHHAQFYFRQINKYIFPIVSWLLLALLFRRGLKPLWGPPESPLRDGVKLSGILIAVGILFLILVPEQRHFRYLLYLLPFLFLAQAILLARLYKNHPALALALGLLLAGTDLLHHSGLSFALAQFPGAKKQLSSPETRPRSLLVEFLGELTHTYRGPVDGVVELLEREALPGQSLKIPYEDHPILFYTDCVVEPVVKPEDFARPTFPDWIVLRRDWLPGGFFESSYYGEIVRRYERRILDAPDIPWQNRPDPGYHRFRTDGSAPRVVVFKKR